MAPWMQPLLDGAAPLGWVAMLVGFLLQRKALMNVHATTRIKGNQNSVTNNIHQTVNDAGGDSGNLARWGSWASIIGLALTLWPLVKPWLSATH
jgi:hypothetical protein